MAEYIEREAAIAVIHKWLKDIFGIDEVECTVLNKRLNAIPAADVRPVTLCKDCICFHPIGTSNVNGDCDKHYERVQFDDYCSWAEVKTNG